MTALDTTQADRLQQIDGLRAGFAERMPRYDRDAAFPSENFDELKALGLHTLTVPREHGGHGMWWPASDAPGEYASYYELLERLATIDTNTAQLLQVHCHATGIVAFHSDAAQMAHYMGDVVENGALISSAGSEAAPRSKQGETYTSELIETPTGWRLSCEKFFCSLSPAADYLMLWVAVPGAGTFAERQVFVMVPRSAPEVEVIDNWDTMGMRSTVSHSVRLTDYEVPADTILGEPGAWVTRDPRTFTLGFTANHLGTAQGAFDHLCSWVRDREYLASSPSVLTELGDMAEQLNSCRSALYAAATTWETGDADEAELRSVQALHISKRIALHITARAFDICGARATFRDQPFGQLYRDVRTYTLHFRDELYMGQVGAAMLTGRFTSKGHGSGSVIGTAHQQA